MHDASWTRTTTHPRDRVRMRVARIALAVLAVFALYQGLWAQLAPRSFYDDFPAGMSWLAGGGPYNEHFVRDIGGLVDGLGVVAAVTAWSMSRSLIVANAVGWLTYAAPHLAFHLVHPLDGVATQTANVVVLCSEVVLPLAGLLGTRWNTGCRSRSAAQRPHTYSTETREGRARR